jgi:2',3'-cyclic-nucleotide 2'-phosphodiesterase (5'-nucleotidase family)
MVGYVDKCLEELSGELDKPIGYTNVELDCRFAKIRSEETALGNWIADMINLENSTEVCIVNSGTIRADSIIKPGIVKLNDLKAMMPYLDYCLVSQINGE